MSRVAKAPITLPANVELHIDVEKFALKGPKGSLEQHYNRLVKVSLCDETKQVTFQPSEAHPNAWAQAGTARALMNNMLVGVTEGFNTTLELVGVGYRAQASGEKVELSLGYSHPIHYKLPALVKAETPNNTTLILRSIDKQLLGQVAAEIRAFRPPEPYKGKGVRRAGEVVRRKEAKKK